MDWISRAWNLFIRDVAVTGLGLWLILRTSLSAAPSDVILTAGLILAAPTASHHALSLLRGPASVSPSSQPASQSPSGDTPGGTGDQNQ